MAEHGTEPGGAVGDAACPLVAALSRVASGERDALREIYDATAGAALGLARRVLRDDALAEDAVVETFEHVWRRAGDFDPGRGTALGWVVLIARYKALELLRGRRARAEYGAHSEPLDGEARATGAGTESPIEPSTEPSTRPTSPTLRAAAARETAERVRRALAALPTEQRAAIEGTFFDGRTHAELASALGLPLGTLKSRVRLGLERLRMTLASLGGDE